MSKEEHREYPDPMATPDERMAAFNVLIGQHPEILNRMLADDVGVKKSSSMSMPNIYERAKRKILDTIEDQVKRKSILIKISKIYENSRAKEDGLSTLERLGLPRYEKVKITIGEFLLDPEKYLNSLKTNKYFPSITNKATGERHFKLDLNQGEVLAFIKEALSSGKITKDNLLILSEFHQNFFSGNIIINPTSKENGQASRSINMELVEGAHTGLAYEGSMPIIRTAATWFERPEIEVLLTEDLSPYLLEEISKVNAGAYLSFRLFKEIVESSEFSTKKDKEKLIYYQFLVEKLMGILNLIPKIDDDSCHFSVNGQTFFPGYYEFILGDAHDKDRPSGVDKIKMLLRFMKSKILGNKAFSIDEILESIGLMKVYFLDYRKADHYSDLQHNYLEEKNEVFA